MKFYMLALILVGLSTITGCSTPMLGEAGSMALPQQAPGASLPNVAVPAPPVIAPPVVFAVIEPDMAQDLSQGKTVVDEAGTGTGDPNQDPCKGKPGIDSEKSTSYLKNTTYDDRPAIVRSYYLEDGTRIGSITSWKDSGGYIMDYVHVEDAFRGKGIATDMLVRSEHDILQRWSGQGPLKRVFSDTHGYNYSCFKKGRPVKTETHRADGDPVDYYDLNRAQGQRPPGSMNPYEYESPNIPYEAWDMLNNI